MIFMFVCVRAHPQEYVPITDGNSLLTSCGTTEESSKDVEQEVGHISCMSYIEGVSDGFLVGETIGKTPKYLQVCIPDGVTRGQMGRVVVAFLKNHPEKLHVNAGTLVYTALNKAFPCK
jgi:hypothetical protein